MRIRGFTLLEILIALAIFAIVAVSSALVLRSVLETSHHLKVSDQRLTEVMTAVTIMRRDITQMLVRPVKDTSGGLLPALLTPNRTQFEFTRAGYTNPLQMSARSTLQRVAYSLKQQTLYRTTWPVLDRAPHTKPSNRVLLKRVRSIGLRFVNAKGEWVEAWENTASNAATLPKALIVTLELKDLGKVKLVFAIRAQGETDD